MVEWWRAFFTTLAAAGLGYLLHAYGTRGQRRREQALADNVVDRARKEAEVIQRAAKTDAREALQSERAELEEESLRRRTRLESLQDEYHDRVRNLEEKVRSLDQKESRLENKTEIVEQERSTLKREEKQILLLRNELTQHLQKLSGLSAGEAKQELLQRVEEDTQDECAALLRNLQAETRATAKDDARKIISLAIERYASDTVSEITTAQVKLPSEEMKGRIIGKEGRNIRCLELETGVNLIIDDTPGVVVLSCFDPMRREVARVTLERLIADGRIHPGTIEDTTKTVRSEIETTVLDAGRNALHAVGLRNVAPEILETLGRLKFRHSYSQNVLDHSVETAGLMATLAGELGLDVPLAKRIGLFHDIGKALSHEREGPHALVGAELLKGAGEDPVVVNAVAAHHRDATQETAYAHLISAADAITAARPGARIENTALYLKRLEDLEAMTNEMDGVLQSYAIHAGRELRIIVKPEKINDAEAQQLARDICNRIEKKLHIQGQIVVTVIRETRAVEYAR